MKVIFLDFDGVLNDCYTLDRVEHPNRPGVKLRSIEAKRVAAVDKVAQLTGAKIVLSTSWRVFGERYCTELLRSKGLTAEVVGSTNLRFSADRNREIHEYVADHMNEIETFVILDDDYTDFGDDIHIRSSEFQGFGMEDVDRAVKILNRRVTKVKR